MSEQQKPKSFMQELDGWCVDKVIEPLIANTSDATVEGVMKAIRAKVLESYHNGLAAGQRQVKQPQTGRRV
jgi:hypothetical protein